MYDVCYVNEYGELKCGTAEVYDIRFEAAVKPAIEAIPGMTPHRLDLILKLIDQVMGSTLDDACIGTRSDDMVGSAHLVLASAPPVMLLYRYNSLPGDILAGYYMKTGKYLAAHAALEHWSTLKAAC